MSMWKHLTISEIVETVKSDNDTLNMFLLSGFSSLFEYKKHDNIYIDECILDNKQNNRLIQLIIETFKSNGYLIKKVKLRQEKTIKFMIYE